VNGLPPIVQRAPGILYGLAILFFFASLGLTVHELSITMAHAEPGNPIVRQTMLRAIYQSALEAVYIAANGVLAHILIAIWRNGSRAQTEPFE
jgi:ABC-type spermidine/putrescine transport system permease subunit II